MDKLRITDPVLKYESIESEEVHEYKPITGTNLNNPGEIRMNIETQDIFTLPCDSYLMGEGTLTKSADGAVYMNGDDITLFNNAILYLSEVLDMIFQGKKLKP